MEDWDWELLHHNTESITPHDEQHHQKLNEYNNSGVIRCDYFSIDHHNYLEDDDDDAGDCSDSPSWMDPNSTTFAGEINRSSSSCSSNSDSSGPTSTHEQLHDDNLDNTTVAGNEEEEEEEREREAKSELNGEEEKREVVGWWRVALEVLRYYVLKVSTPVWSLSMAAAAIMGFIIMRRRYYYLYKMKSKTQGFQLKLTLDDKKVSQFMSRAAPLNDAFSVVKRVPMIRLSLPAPGLAPWPVMSMR